MKECKETFLLAEDLLALNSLFMFLFLHTSMAKCVVRAYVKFYHFVMCKLLQRWKEIKIGPKPQTSHVMFAIFHIV